LHEGSVIPVASKTDGQCFRPEKTKEKTIRNDDDDDDNNNNFKITSTNYTYCG
jgi:hypothetical protein